MNAQQRFERRKALEAEQEQAEQEARKRNAKLTEIAEAEESERLGQVRRSVPDLRKKAFTACDNVEKAEANVIGLVFDLVDAVVAEVDAIAECNTARSLYQQAAVEVGELAETESPVFKLRAPQEKAFVSVCAYMEKHVWPRIKGGYVRRSDATT